jgi:hypothetical protein
MITSDATNDVVLQRKKATRRPGLRACRTASPAARPSYEPSQNPPGVLSPDVYVTLTANVASSISTRVPPAAATGPPRQSPRPRPSPPHAQIKILRLGSLGHRMRSTVPR